MRLSPDLLLWLGPGVIGVGGVVWLLSRSFNIKDLSLLGNSASLGEPLHWTGRKGFAKPGIVIMAAGLALAGLGVFQKIFTGEPGEPERSAVAPPILPTPVVVSANEASEFREKFDRTLKLFQETNDYEESRKRFLDLYDQASLDETREVLEGLVTATYYGTSSHREGLDYICELYKEKPPSDHRHRFRIHAHLRQIALKESFPAAEKLISQLRSKYKRSDLSQVWPCIPLAKMEYLREGYTVFEEFYKLSGDDESCLKKVMDRYQDDPFLDHAFYFSGQFDRVIADYPDTYILDIAYRAAGQQALKAGDHGKAVRLLTKALKLNPKRRDEMVAALAAAYQESGDLESLIALRMRYRFKDERPLLESLGQRGPFKSPRQLAAMLKVLAQHEEPDKLKDLLSNQCSSYFAVARTALVQNNYARALQEYEEMVGVFRDFNLSAPPCLVRARDVLVDLVGGFESKPAGELLSLGLSLRDHADPDDKYEPEDTDGEQIDLGNDAFYSAAVGAWKACAERCSQAEKEKSLYLAARLERYQQNFGEAASLLRKLADQHPASPLADDALAELGWYYLHVRSDHAAARRVLQRVRDRYPKGNAADNALNLLGQSYFMTGDYKECQDTYLELRRRYRFGPGYGRIVRHVPHNLEILQPLVDSMTERREVSGLDVEAYEDPDGGVYVTGVEKGSDAEKAGILEGDIIRSVGDESAGSTAEFYGVLARMKGNWANLRVTREQGSDLRLKARIRTGRYYEGNPQGYLLPEF